jgi:hypothetical protein
LEEISKGTVHADGRGLDCRSPFGVHGTGGRLHAAFFCHGNEAYLASDDGWREMQMLGTEQIKNWISLGGRKYEFVFASA